MAEVLRLDITPAGHSWAHVKLTDSQLALEFVALYTPRDSIGELAGAASGLVAGVPEQVVTWNTEPVEYEFRFVTNAGRSRLEVYEFPDGRRQRRGAAPIAEIEAEASTIARAVWRGLRRLEGAMSAAEYAQLWGHPFPIDAVKRLGAQLR